MTRCQDCIHYKICDEWAKNVSDEWAVDCEPNPCEHFINTDNVIVLTEIIEGHPDPVGEQGESAFTACRTEVAREIFEEIEFDIHQLMFDREETRAIAIEGIIANLKKKYVGE